MVLTHTITVLELLWTIVASIGLIFMTGLLQKSWQDNVWLDKTLANGDHDLRKYVAITSVLIFLGGVVTQLIYTITGAIAMTQPSLHQKPHLPQIITSLLFIFSSAFGTIAAAFIHYRRDKVIKVVAQRFAKEQKESNAVHT